ncbi:MAG TPA: D-2-hydroxyacid dehydrogenase family protein [Alphaproteobacteria bacterium]|nr:D-2-hydroxyacid dehydrogenase family protein [Alphaproteobacteria bacterium]
MKVAVLDDFTDVARSFADWSPVEKRAELTIFRDHLTDNDALAVRLAPFDVVAVMRERTPLPRELLDRLPNLKCIVTSGMRNASIDEKAATDRGIVVCGTESVGFTTAEHAWAMLMAAARNIPQEEAAFRRGTWQLGVGTTLRGRRLGILGLGKIGTQVAAFGKAFGMDVVAWSQNLTDERASKDGARRLEKDELLSTSDFITIHLVLSPRTRHLIGAREFGLMKSSAILVNTSRGPIIDEAALIEALKSKRIRRAALDVYDVEPLPKDHPLLKLDNAVLTPHLGYVNDHNYSIFYPKQIEDIMAFLDGRPIRVINEDVLARARRA